MKNIIQGDNMAANLKILETRAEIIRAIRTFFVQQDFLEVETPVLVPSPGMEPHLEPFETLFIPEGSNRFDNPDNSTQHDNSVQLYLPTSPEFHMKRLLCQGCNRIFQICRAFRNGETGHLHQPEFTILEWYRTNENYEKIMEDTENLFHYVAMKILGTGFIHKDKHSIDLSPPWERMTVKNAWKKFTGIDLDQCNTTKTLRNAGQKIDVPHLLEDDSYDVLYFKIFLARIEPHLGMVKPTFLFEYPADMAALARLKPEDTSVALRFEIYAAGLELGNAFDELTDAEIQLHRCREAQTIQKNMGKSPFPIDISFINDLKKGMPPSAGIAVGVDRMIMLLLGKNSISDVVAFPFKFQNGS